MGEYATVLLGPMAPPLVKQGFDDDDGELQKDVDQISRLHMRGVLTGADTDRAHQRIAKRLTCLPSPPEDS